MDSIPQEYVELAEQIATKLEDWAEPKDETGLRHKYVGHLKPIGIALEGFEEILNWLHSNRPESGEYVQSAYNRLVSQAKLDDHLLDSLYEGEEVFSEGAALGLAFTLREIVKMPQGVVEVVADKPSIEDVECRRLSEGVRLLREFRSTFMSCATVESEGIFPWAFWDFDKTKLGGATGILYLNAHPATGKISCRFIPKLEGEEQSWTHHETDYDLNEYERLLFSTWSYDTGYALNRNEESRAVWYIEDQAFADQLEDIAGRIDNLLNAMHEVWGLPSHVHSAMVAVRNHTPKWKCGRVAWHFVMELDRCIRDFELECKRLSMVPRTAEPKVEAEKEAQSNQYAPAAEEPKKPGPRSKYTSQKIKNMLTSYEKHLQEKNDVKYAWNCVAEEHGIPSGKAAEMAVGRYRKKNK